MFDSLNCNQKQEPPWNCRCSLGQFCYISLPLRIPTPMLNLAEKWIERSHCVELEPELFPNGMTSTAFIAYTVTHMLK